MRATPLALAGTLCSVHGQQLDRAYVHQLSHFPGNGPQGSPQHAGRRAGGTDAEIRSRARGCTENTYALGD